MSITTLQAFISFERNVWRLENNQLHSNKCDCKKWRVNHTAIDTKHNTERHKKNGWTTLPQGERERETFFSFTQEACTLPFLAAQHVIRTCTPLKKGLHACCPVLFRAPWKFPLLQVTSSVRQRQTAEAVVAACLSLYFYIWGNWEFANKQYETVRSVIQRHLWP